MTAHSISIPARYQPIGSAGQGGQGDIIICEDTHLNRKVAIKVLHNQNQIRRLLDELKALLLMRSKFVVQVYDVIPDASSRLQAIVEEYIDGEDLSSYAGVRTNATAYMNILFQIAAGITDIHRAGLIHRDIKPENIRRDTEGVIKILDFGLARDETTGAKTKGFIGTKEFAAPEQFGRANVVFTNAIDVFSFGATALALAKGNLPTEDELSNKDFSGTVISLPSELIVMLKSCLAENPTDRPAIAVVKDLLHNLIVRDRHQAVAVAGAAIYHLNSTNRGAKIAIAGMGEIVIGYDGLTFTVSDVSGSVYINNRPALTGMILPGSCVVVIGSPEFKGRRRFITFDISNPEVMT